MRTPSTGGLDPVVTALASWQRDEAPIQLHPGDLGWHWRFGASELAGLLRVWSRGDEIVAVGFLDGASLVRMALAPGADEDEELAAQLVADLEDPSRCVLTAAVATAEVRSGHAVRSLLTRRGWVPDEAWSPLRRDLTAPVETAELRVETVGPQLVHDRVAVQRAAFQGARPMTEERWHTMAAGTPYRQARCLVGYDDRDAAVGIATVWSAGPHRPGLLEPLGVHRDHRGRGHGAAMALAAAAALREMGASSALVATPRANVAAVAAYRSAGFTSSSDVTDFRRPLAATSRRG